MSQEYKFTVVHTKRIDPMTKSFTKAVQESIEWKQKRGLPIAKYDPDTDTAYLEYADGRRKIVTVP